MSAGRHARIYSAIWQDEDFRALTAGPQRLYLFLLSQPNVTHLGVLPLTYRRWVKGCSDYTLDALHADLDVLAVQRYVVVDEDTEELLIRTLLRNDQVYKQPNVLLSAINSASGIGSALIRQVLVSEVDKVNVDQEIRDDGKSSSEGKRASAKEGLQRLRGILGNTPWNPSPNPSENPSPGVPRTHNARTTRAAPSPTPSPTPAHTSSAASGGAQQLVAEWIEHCAKRPPARVIGQVSRDVRLMLDEGLDYEDVRRGLAAWAAKGLNPSTLPSEVNAVMNATARTGLALASGDPRPSTTDRNVAQSLALVAELRAQEAR